MKKIFTFIFFVMLTSMEIPAQSISIYGGYSYYFMQLDKYGSYIEAKNKSNYIIGGSINKYFKSAKLEFGFAYGTKNYYFNYLDVHSTIQREDIELNYYFMPLLFNQRIFSDSNNTFSISIGTAFIKPFGYSKESILKDGNKNYQSNIPVNYKLGNIAKLGLRYSKRITNFFLLYSELYGNYKFNMDYHESGPRSLQYFNLTDDKFDIGINIGIEWLFSKQELAYYKKKK